MDIAAGNRSSVNPPNCDIPLRLSHRPFTMHLWREGDLSKRKLLPALPSYRENELPAVSPHRFGRHDMMNVRYVLDREAALSPAKGLPTAQWNEFTHPLRIRRFEKESYKRLIERSLTSPPF